MNAPTLTKLEMTVLAALIESSEGNGHDFGFIEDARNAVANKNQLGGIVASLSKKDILVVYEPVRTDSGEWTQFTFTPDGDTDAQADEIGEFLKVLLAQQAVETSPSTVEVVINITANELTLLKALLKSARQQKVDPVEMAIAVVNPFENKYVGAGVFASCTRKGLVQSQDYGTVNHRVSLTEAGLAAMKHAKAAK